MTVAKFMTRPDTLNDIGILVVKSFHEIEKAGTKTFAILKFILYDVTILLQKLPFGNWISLIYFVCMSNAIKNVVEGGELNRLLSRAIHLYFVQQKSYKECLSRFGSYLWRIARSQVHEVKSYAYGIAAYAWDYTGGSVKREVKRIAKEIILENTEGIERTIKDVTKTAAFAAMINVLSQKIASDLGPVAMDAFSRSIVDITDNIESTNTDILQKFQSLQTDIQTLSLNLAETIEEANTRGELHLLENNVLLNRKLAEISMQLEYLRVNQPTQFREIMNLLPLSTMSEVFTKLTHTLGSSLSQTGQRRIENI